MTYEIHVTTAAQADLESIFDDLSAYSQRSADHTYALIKDAIRGLNEFPRRFAVARESAQASIEIRQLVVGNYRVLYLIVGDRVVVQRIVHSSRATLRPSDLM